MDKLNLYKIMMELRQQCQFCQLAWKEIKSGLNGLDPERVFFYVHAFLDHADNISRFLWPVRPVSQERGDLLRAGLGVGEDSPLKLAALRPQLSGEDEQFEDWLAGLDNPEFVDLNVMPMAAIADFKPDSFHRSLDSETYKMHLRGVPGDLKSISDAVRKLEVAVQSWLKTHHPW